MVVLTAMWQKTHPLLILNFDVSGQKKEKKKNLFPGTKNEISTASDYQNDISHHVIYQKLRCTHEQ